MNFFIKVLVIPYGFTATSFKRKPFLLFLAALARAPESSKLDKIDAQNSASKKEQGSPIPNQTQMFDKINA